MLKTVFLIISTYLIIAQDISMSAHVESATVTEKSMFKLYVEFIWNGKLKDYKVSINDEPTFYGLEVLGKGSSNKIFKTETGIDQCKYTIIYNLKPIRKGKASIEGLRAQAVFSESGDLINLSAGNIDLTVNKFVEPFSITSKTSLTIIAAVFVFLSLVWILVLANRRKREKLNQLNSMEVPVEEELINKIKRMSFTEGVPEKVAKEFIQLFEEYNSKVSLENLELSFDYSRFKDKIDRYKYSGDAPDIYEFDQMKIDFSEILSHNLSQKKNEVNQ